MERQKVRNSHGITKIIFVAKKANGQQLKTFEGMGSESRMDRKLNTPLPFVGNLLIPVS